MQRATRIEARPARWARRLAIQILTDGQLSAAGAAQHRLLIELSRRPNPGGMIGFLCVTVEAGIVGQTAVESYRDDIELAAIVRAARARIYLHPSYRNSRNRELHVTLPQTPPAQARLSAFAELDPVDVPAIRNLIGRRSHRPIERVPHWRRDMLGQIKSKPAPFAPPHHRSFFLVEHAIIESSWQIMTPGRAAARPYCLRKERRSLPAARAPQPS